MFLEMAGGDMETAVSIFFSNMDGGGDPAPMQGVVDTSPSPAAGGATSAPEWWGMIWPAAEEPPEAWKNQRLDNPGGEVWKGGIPQPKNGPCGVLAVVHGLIIAEQHTREPKDIELSPNATAKVILTILTRCKPDAAAPLVLVRPKAKGDYR